MGVHAQCSTRAKAVPPCLEGHGSRKRQSQCFWDPAKVWYLHEACTRGVAWYGASMLSTQDFEPLTGGVGKTACEVCSGGVS